VPIRFVSDVADSIQLLVPNQLGDPLDQTSFVHLVGNLGDNDRLSLGLLLHLDFRSGSHHQLPATGVIGPLDPLAPGEERAGRKVGPRDELH
jgi:hypothetical protein